MIPLMVSLKTYNEDALTGFEVLLNKLCSIINDEEEFEEV